MSADPLVQRAIILYKRLFSIEEFERSDLLPWVFGAILVGFLMLANSLIGNQAITVQGVLNNTSVCWPWFPDCGNWHFLVGAPEGYSQRLTFALIFGLLVTSAFFIWKKDWVIAHASALVVYLFFVFVIYVLEGRSELNYGDHLMVLATVLLFFRNKLFYLRLTVVLLYVYAGLSKLNDGWLMGTRFSWRESGLPFVFDEAIPLATNVVVFMELIGAWFLLARSQKVRIPVLGFFVIFQLYTILFTGFTYSVVALPLLLLLFSRPSPQDNWPQRLQPGALIFLGALTVLQFVHFTIPGDVRVTQEGGMYAFHGFAARHWCISRATYLYADGTARERVNSDYGRCDPYPRLFFLQRSCQQPEKKLNRITWTFDQSINGGLLYRIVDEPNACVLIYRAFSHNEWIRLDPVAVSVSNQ